MAEQDYIALRCQNPGVPDATGSLAPKDTARAFALAPEMLEIEEAALTKARRDRRRRDPSAPAVFECVPMELVKPLESDEARSASAAIETWGVKAVRATDSPRTDKGIATAMVDTTTKRLETNIGAAVKVEEMALQSLNWTEAIRTSN